ncbi:MAG: peptidoglycan DD-metalloendopeptidase family protein, partial [Rhodospirillaceae bacterium]|nr:peptidoglycan DD-metalloendopeptidase family protein [Rhodospirillaceae bacterium]
MLLKGFITATVLTVGALVSLEVSKTDAATEPRPGTPDSVSLAPISLGTPEIARALAALSPARPIQDLDAKNPSVAQNPMTYEISLTVKRADTLAGILGRAGVTGVEANEVIRALSEVFSPRGLKIGQKVAASYVPSIPDAESGTLEKDRFVGLAIPLDYQNRIEVRQGTDGSYKAAKVKLELDGELVRAEGIVTSSLYLAATRAGVSAPVVSELIRAFSWDVDFQRDIWKNDGFEVMFQRYRNDEGRTVHENGIVYASLNLRGERKAIYLHTLKDGTQDYFDEKGNSAKKALMRTPIDGARLSSSFGKRKHPILGYTKMHKGADFAAARGTPIYAAGNGSITMAGRNGAYGNYVRIRHNSEYSTAYAHMKSFKRGIS